MTKFNIDLVLGYYRETSLEKKGSMCTILVPQFSTISQLLLSVSDKFKCVFGTEMKGKSKGTENEKPHFYKLCN